MHRPHRFRDPVTGDELTLGEEVSWVLQGVIRRWTVFAAITVFTLFAWIHGQIWAQGWTTIWNLFASYWAMALETVVGIAMFSQTRRDAVKIRKIERVLDTMQVLVTLVCRQLGIEGAPESSGSDVHVDWHMTPDEWRQLQGVLRSSLSVPYLARLSAEGKLGDVTAGDSGSPV